MFVSPVPRIGEVIVGQDVPGRVLRVSVHPNSDRVVLSIWQDGACLATLRLSGDDVPGVVQALTSAAVSLAPPAPVAVPIAPPPATGDVMSPGQGFPGHRTR